MPGRVVRVLVAVGDHVTAKQPVVVVEAMKMENELRTPRDGVVKEVLVSAGRCSGNWRRTCCRRSVDLDHVSSYECPRFKRFERIRSHFAFRFTKLGVVVLAVTLAVAIVATLTVDLGPGLRGLAEREGSKRVGRPMHIGRLGVRLFNGKFVLEDFVIEGLVPTDRPFLTAKRIDVSLTWDALLPSRSARRFGRDDRLAHGARAVGRRQAQLPEIQHGRQQQQPPALRHDDAVRADEEWNGHVRRSRIAMGQRSRATSTSPSPSSPAIAARRISTAARSGFRTTCR